MNDLLKTPERAQRFKSTDPRRNLFDVDDEVSNLSPTSSEISSPAKNATSLKNLASNFNQMFLNKTPPRSAPGSLRPRRSPRLLKGIAPLPDDDGTITTKQFYGKTLALKEGDGAGLFAAALSSLPKARTRLFFDDMSASKKRSRTASHGIRSLKRAKTEPELNKSLPSLTIRKNKFKINFPKKKSPHVKKEKTPKTSQVAKRKARDEPDNDVPLKRTIMGTKTRYNFEIFSTGNYSTKKVFKNMNSSITMTPPSSTKKKNLLSSQRVHIDSPHSSPARRTLKDLRNNVQSPSTQKIELEQAEIVKEIQEILDDDDENAGNDDVTNLLEKLGDDEGKENESDSTIPSFATPERSKYFSVFNTTPESSHSSTHSPREMKKGRRRTTLGIGPDQLLLDVGQSKLREVECETCGLVYLNGVPEDEINHDKHHAEVTQMLFNGFKNERIVRVIGESRISLIKECDPIAWKRKVSVYISLVDSELGFPSDGFPRQVYMYVKNKRVVGLLLAKHLDRALRLLTCSNDNETVEPLSDNTLLCSEETYPTKCGISRVWVAQSERRQGVAAAMLDALRRNFISHCILSVNDIAFSAPTADGIAFAKKYCKRSDFLVYM